jgi:hypothetical protein
MQISMGGEVPKSYYLNKNKPECGNHMKSELVPAGNRKRIEIVVEEAKSIMRQLLFFETFVIVSLILSSLMD